MQVTHASFNALLLETSIMLVSAQIKEITDLVNGEKCRHELGHQTLLSLYFCFS